MTLFMGLWTCSNKIQILMYDTSDLQILHYLSKYKWNLINKALFIIVHYGNIYHWWWENLISWNISQNCSITNSGKVRIDFLMDSRLKFFTTCVWKNWELTSLIWNRSLSKLQKLHSLKQFLLWIKKLLYNHASTQEDRIFPAYRRAAFQGSGLKKTKLFSVPWKFLSPITDIVNKHPVLDTCRSCRCKNLGNMDSMVR